MEKELAAARGQGWEEAIAQEFGRFRTSSNDKQ